MIPKIVKIGSYDYKIKYANKLIMDEQKLWGLFDAETQTISLQKGMSPDRKDEIFLHECIHAIDDVYDINLSERQTKILAMAILEFLQRNKKWLDT